MTTPLSTENESPLLALARHYYAVAQDLEANGRRQLEIAEFLSRIADGLCEKNMREQPDTRPASQGE